MRKLFNHSRSVRIAWAVALLICGGLVWAQKRVNYGRNLDANNQQYTLRGDMGHKLDNNLRVGGSGYNGSNAALMQSGYQVRRGATPNRTTTTNRYGQQLQSHNQERYAAGLARGQYSPPVYSDAYRDALSRTGRNPNMVPGRIPPAYVR